MHAVGHVSDRHFVPWPARKEWLKEPPTYLPMQATHTIDRPATADGQIRHVKILCRVMRVLTAQGQEIVEWDAEFVLSVPPR
jgi:hypothetical protein